MRKLITALIAIMLLSPVASAAVKWNNSSTSNSSAKDSAAWWAKTKESKSGFVCDNEMQVAFTIRGKEIKQEVRNEVLLFPQNGGFKSELPTYLDPCVNDKTINYYYSRWLRELKEFNKYIIEPSSSPKNIEVKTKESAFLEKQLSHNEILSYLYYDNGAVIYDGLAPQERFTFELNDATEFRTNSVGKSFVSYLIGHAICEGYLDSPGEKLSTWPLIKNTLYSQLTLIDLLNMRARDQHVVTEGDGFIKTGRWINPVSIRNAALIHVKDTKPNKDIVFNYNGFSTNLAMNFLRFKVGQDWEVFLNRVFQDKIGISYPFSFLKTVGIDEADGLGMHLAYATRYDQLRLAIALLEDWQTNNCMGRYLKEMEKGKMPISTDSWFFDIKPKDARNKRHFASKYGGYFYFDYTGMDGRNILGMEGKGGQSILIDLDNSRIVIINAANDNYDWYELAYRPIKFGKLKKN